MPARNVNRQTGRGRGERRGIRFFETERPHRTRARDRYYRRRLLSSTDVREMLDGTIYRGMYFLRLHVLEIQKNERLSLSAGYDGNLCTFLQFCLLCTLDLFYVYLISIFVTLATFLKFILFTGFTYLLLVFSYLMSNRASH